MKLGPIPGDGSAPHRVRRARVLPVFALVAAACLLVLAAGVPSSRGETRPAPTWGVSTSYCDGGVSSDWHRTLHGAVGEWTWKVRPPFAGHEYGVRLLHHVDGTNRLVYQKLFPQHCGRS